MAQRAFVLGGTGQIGRAVARRFLDRGWSVAVGARSERDVVAGAEYVRVDREQGLGAIGEADAVVDVVAYERRHGEQLLELAGRIGTVVAISSASVYADDHGRTLDEATGVDDFPDFGKPVDERQRTVEPGETTYSTKKVALERVLLEQDETPATIVRPCAVYGVGSPLPRELHFVKRVVDGRRVVVLAHRGASRFHTTAVRNLAEIVVLAAERPGTRIVNCGDPGPPSVLEIARIVASYLGHEWDELLLAGEAHGTVGANPWGVPRPFLVDMANAELELRYRPVVTYRRAVEPVCEWLVDALQRSSSIEQFPRVAQYMSDDFDYAAEDEYLRGLGT